MPSLRATLCPTAVIAKSYQPLPPRVRVGTLTPLPLRGQSPDSDPISQISADATPRPSFAEEYSSAAAYREEAECGSTSAQSSSRNRRRERARSLPSRKEASSWAAAEWADAKCVGRPTRCPAPSSTQLLICSLA